MIKITKNWCHKCKSEFIPKRNPNQQYCSQRACQNERKCQWRKDRLKSDADYKVNQNAATSRWRKKNSSYWKKYRQNNDGYTQNNKYKQKERNLKRYTIKLCQKQATVIANSDALTLKNSIPTGTYSISPYNKVIANSDALIINISVISSSYEINKVIYN